MGRIAFWTILALGALAIGGGGYLYREGMVPLGTGPAGGNGVANAAPAPAREKVVAVEAAAVVLDTVRDEIHAVGSLRPNESVVVAPEIAGRIDRFGFAEGDRVAAGDVLVELDSAILRAELAKSESDMVLARANHERATQLARQGTGTLRARDEAIAAFHAAQADVALSRARLEKSRIAAPLSGIVGLRAVSVGAYVTPGDRIVELVDIDPIKVDFRVPELALSRLQTGQAIAVAVDALPGRAFTGEVYAIDPIVDPDGRAVRLRARIANPDGILSPGLFARVSILVERRDDAVLVPESAVFSEGRERFVYRVVDGRTVRTAVELGQRRPGEAEVREGLAPGDVVVTAGHQQVRDGTRVEVVTAGAGS